MVGAESAWWYARNRASSQQSATMELGADSVSVVKMGFDIEKQANWRPVTWNGDIIGMSLDRKIDNQ